MYYPYLRWKQGEMKALENEPGDWNSMMCPLWIVEAPKEELVDAVLGMVSLWSGNQILDMSRVEVKSVEDELFIATSSTDIPFAIQPKTLRYLRHDLRELFVKEPCFRIACFNSIEEATNEDFHNEQLEHIRPFVENHKLKVIIDWGVVEERHVTKSSSLAKIVNLYLNAGVNEVIVSGGSFPTMLQDVLGVEYITRFEKQLFDNLADELSDPIAYSDYATLSPDWSYSGVLRSNHINIRYTYDDYWLVLRQPGKNKEAIYELTQLLVPQKEFRGGKFSWADDIWEKRAAEPPLVGPGNSTFHVSEFIHHHIAQVLRFG